jgi:methanogenic corrinoid protein MtbC1
VAPPPDLLELIEARRRDDLVAAVRAVHDVEGIDAAVALLAEVQVEVGTRWQDQRWTVADEHAASAMIDHALSAVAAASREPSGDRPVVVACAEEEWHVLPARMVAEQLRDRGWPTVFLGASSPAPDLERYLAALDPVALALSCALPTNLPGARRSVEAGHAAGVPVAAGGGAFADRKRADAIGADAWCATAAELHHVLTSWARERPVLAEPAVPAPEALTGRARAEVLDATLAAITARVAPLADAPRHRLDRLCEDLDGLLASVEAAAHTGDRDLVTQHARWLRSVSEARGEPEGLTAVALEALLGALPASVPLRGELAVEV